MDVDKRALWKRIEERVGKAYADERVSLESDRALISPSGIAVLKPKHWHHLGRVLSAALRLAGLLNRGLSNAEQVQLRTNVVRSRHLPPAFHGFSILHLSDLHVEGSGAVIDRMCALIKPLQYDICVLTGDFCGDAFGSYEEAIAGVEKIRECLQGPAFGVLGNHDPIQILPALEEMGIRVLVNESVEIGRENTSIFLGGIDDARFFRMHDLSKASKSIPRDAYSILLSHTPEIYDEAAHGGFNMMLAGHTHGGQICLPGSIPLTVQCPLPRRFAAGPWRYRNLDGYTSTGAGSSVIPVRFNCPPEVTLHRLEHAA